MKHFWDNEKGSFSSKKCHMKRLKMTKMDFEISTKLKITLLFHFSFGGKG